MLDPDLELVSADLENDSKAVKGMSVRRPHQVSYFVSFLFCASLIAAHRAAALALQQQQNNNNITTGQNNIANASYYNIIRRHHSSL